MYETAISSLTATENGMPFEATLKDCYNKATKKAAPPAADELSRFKHVAYG